MARSVNDREHAERRKEILDAAQRMIYAKGYEAMSIQDLLDELGISKGAFYHYYGSKQALLEAFVVRLTEEGVRQIAPYVEDPELGALVKFQKVMAVGMEWKTGQRDMLLSLMRSWYGDENLKVRLRANALGQTSLSPLIARIVRQGVEEGVFQTPDPERAAEMFMVMGFALSETIVTEMLRTPAPGAERLERILATAKAYEDFYERILGAPAGSIRLVDPDLMRKWTP
jgi:TetR/AcrR family transcriptional regulator, transcriptional repressor for nem operon